MTVVTTIGLDLAKNIFQVHGVDNQGRTTLQKRLSRGKVAAFFANLPPCLIGMEACGGSHYWSRKISEYGHTVRQIPPQYVKPYVKTNKNDANDAEAICEAVSRPSMRFVQTKSLDQQDILALHRIRERLVNNRTGLANQTRGFLMELGVVLPQGIRHIRKELPRIYEDLGNSLTLLERDYLSDLYSELVEIDEKIAKYDSMLTVICKKTESCMRLMTVPGIGFLSATALVATAGDAKDFKNGREFSAWLGLVPRQKSSGGKTKLLGISKRGDGYLRKLLVHGSRAIIYHRRAKDDPRSLWIKGVISRSGKFKAIIAQANKTARIAWAVLAKQEEYREAA